MPPPARNKEGEVDASTEPGAPVDPSALSVFRDDPELARRLGTRSPEEIYGEEDDEGSVSRSETRGLDGSQAGQMPRSPSSSDLSLSKDATRAGPPMRVEIVEGPDKGTVRRFHGVRLVVGRVKGCDLLLADPSVSRRHVELVLGEKGVLLRDLGSGNGTKLNGERVTEQVLAHGDVVALGQTKIRFVDEQEAHRQAALAEKKAEEAGASEAQALAAAQASPPQEAEGRGKGPGPIAKLGALSEKAAALPRPVKWGGVCVAALALLLALFAWIHHPPAPSKPATRPETPKLIAGAQNALREGRAADAQELLAQIQKLDPSADVARLAARILVDKKAKNSMDVAEGLIAQRRFDDARAELSRTPEGDEVFRARHDALVASVTQTQVKVLQQTFRAALARRDFAAAQEAMDAFPRQFKTEELRAQFDQERKRAEEEAAEEEQKRESAKKKAHDVATERRRAQLETAFAAVSKRLDDLDFTRAALECDRIMEKSTDDAEIRDKAMHVKSQVLVLSRNFKDGQQKLDAHASESAVRSLRYAHDVYYTYMGMQGELGHKLDTMLATALLGEGRGARGRHNASVAVRDLAEVVKLAPGTELAQEAQTEIDRMESEAAELFAQAQAIKDQNPTQYLAKMRGVLDLTRPESGWHQKAKRALLGRSSGRGP
jgi:hypothetical protein